MVRRTLLTLAACAVIALPAAAEEPTLDSVLAQYYETIGGLDALKAIDSVKMSGKMIMGEGMEAPFTMQFKRPMMARLEFEFQGMTGIQAYDGEGAWFVMPFMGKPDPEPMPAEQAKMMREQADLDGPLVGWKDKGHQVELLGVEDVDGTDAYKLKVTLDTGDERIYYLDTDYALPFKIESKTMMQGQEVDTETILGDYKEVGGTIMPHSIESKPKGAPSGQVITIDEAVANVEMDAALFEMPEVEKAVAAADGE